MPKIVDHEKYKEELVIKCFELFSKKGFSNVTIREVANELDISTGTLYHYFSTKQAIFEEMLKAVGKLDVIQVVERIDDEVSVEGKLKKFTFFLEEKKLHYQNLMLLLVDFYRNNDPSISEKVIKEFAAYYSNAICSNLDIPERFGQMIIMWLIGLIYYTLLIPSSISIEDQVLILQELLLAYISAIRKKNNY